LQKITSYIRKREKCQPYPGAKYHPNQPPCASSPSDSDAAAKAHPGAREAVAVDTTIASFPALTNRVLLMLRLLLLLLLAAVVVEAARRRALFLTTLRGCFVRVHRAVTRDDGIVRVVCVVC
jgi:hypothetical protein